MITPIGNELRWDAYVYGTRATFARAMYERLYRRCPPAPRTIMLQAAVIGSSRTPAEVTAAMIDFIRDLG